MFLERLKFHNEKDIKIVCDICLENENSISIDSSIIIEGMGKSEVIMKLITKSRFIGYPLSLMKILYICPDCHPIYINNLKKLSSNPVYMLNWNSKRFIEKDHNWGLIGPPL